jgi:hypothetical protein
MATDPGELLDAIDDAEVIGTVTDAMGDYVKVGVLRDAALIGVSGSPAILDTPERQAEFDGYWAEARRRAGGPRTVTFDLSDADAYHVIVTALGDYAAGKRAVLADGVDNESFARWADLADRMRAQAEEAG